MNYSRPFTVTVLFALSACGPVSQGSQSVIDSSCEAMAAELANCADITDGSAFKPCAVSAENVAKCTDICTDPAQCSIPDGAISPKPSTYLGTYAIRSSFQNIPEQWPDSVTLASDTANTHAIVSGISLLEEKHRVYSIPATLIEKDNRFLLIGAVRHYEPGCAQANLEVFALSATASGSTKQLGCLPIEVQHTYLPIQWCGHDSKAKAKEKLVQFTTTWTRLIEAGDRCAPEPLGRL